MRTAIVFGILALFVSVSFVPPGAIGAQAAREPVAFAVSVDVPDTDDVRSALHALLSALSLPAEEIEKARSQPVTDAPRTTRSTVVQDIPTVTPHTDHWLDARNADPDATIRHTFTTIEWAREKRDPHACHDLPPYVMDERVVDGVIRKTPSKGDWLAYCLARVTGQKKRCTQIGAGSSPDLRSLCEQELF